MTEDRISKQNTDRRNAALLFEKYGQHLFRVAANVLKNDADAEDAVQQLFYDMLRKGNVPDADDPRCKAYLSVAVERKAVDLLRTRRNDASIEDAAEAAGEQNVPSLSPLAEAISKLPASDRELLLLKYYMGYKATEIAQRTGEAPNTVQKRILRARQKLKTMLTEQEGDE